MGGACSTDSEVITSMQAASNNTYHNNDINLNTRANQSMASTGIGQQDVHGIVQRTGKAASGNQSDEKENESEKTEQESECESEKESEKSAKSESENESDKDRNDPHHVTDENSANGSDSNSDDNDDGSEKPEEEKEKKSSVDNAYQKTVKLPSGNKRTERLSNLSDPQRLEAALLGRLDVEYQNLSQIVRIFTSSTFTDTQVERNTLMERIYPKLKSFCQERGFAFQVVDMRWGVRDEATEDHMTSELCMRELSECQKLSTGPNFITFLGQKYGYRPFPPKIGAELFEKMLSVTADQTDKDLLTFWFQRDDNSLPPYYLLQSITSKLPDYGNEEKPALKKQAQDKWWSSFERIQVILRLAADKVIPDSRERHQFYWSVTEEEITRGLIDVPDPKSHCYWFRRVITDLTANSNSPKARFFMDISSKVDEEAASLLNQFKEKQILRALPPENIKTYEVKWTDNGIDTKASKEHSDYIAKLCEDFYAVLTQMIENGIEKNRGIASGSELQLECLQQSLLAQKRCDVFYGRQDLLQQIKNHLAASPAIPLVLFGQAGSGKTSLIAKSMESIPGWFEKKNILIIGRFLGTSTASSGVQKLLSSLCQQLAKGCRQKEENLDKESLKNLKKKFSSLLEQCANKIPVYVFLDSLDQLDDSMNGREMTWLPLPLPSNACLIMSTLPDQEYSILPNLQAKYSDIKYLDVPLLKDADITDMLSEYLVAKDRQLQPAQIKVVKSACEKCATPLFLKIVVDEALSWKSYTFIEEGVIKTTVTEVINALFEKVEKYHGRVLVSHVLSYITCTKSGLSENEIEDILSCDDEVLNDVYQYHIPPLRRLPPLLWVRIRYDLRDYLADREADGTQVITWYHRQFHQVASQRYLSDSKIRIKRHAHLAEYYMGKWSNGLKKPYTDKKGASHEADRILSKQLLVIREDKWQPVFNIRKMNELPYHLIHSRQSDLLKTEVLCNLMFLCEKIRALGVSSVMNDFKLVEPEDMLDKELKAMRTVILRSVNALSADTHELPVQLSARLRSGGYKELPFIKQFLIDCEDPPFPCLTTVQGFLKGGSGSLLQKFVGSDNGVDNIGVSSDGNRIVTAGIDCQLQIWDVEAGKQVTDIYCGDDAVNSLNAFLFYKNNQILASAGLMEFIVWDLRSGSLIKQHKVSENIQNHPVPLARLSDCGWTLVLRESLLVFKEDIWEKVCEFKNFEPAPADKHYQQRDFCGGSGKLAVIKRGGLGRFLILDVQQYKKDNTGITKVDILKPGQDASKFIIQTELTNDGKIPCLIYEADKYQENICSFKVFSLKSGKLVKSFSGFDMGFCVGSEVIRVRDNNHVLFSHFIPAENNTVVKDINLTTGEFTDVGRVTSVCQILMPLDKNRFMSVSATNPTVVNVDTLEHGSKKGGGAEGSAVDNEDDLVEEKFEKQADVIQPVPGSKRYMLSGYSNKALQIWDAAEMKMVRDVSIFGNGYTSLSRMVNTNVAVTITHTDKVMAYDLKTPKNLGSQTKGLSKESAVNGKMNVAEGGGHVFLATKNGLEIRDVLSDKVVKILTAGSEGLQTLIVNQEGNIVVGSSETTNDINILYVFDVKAQRRLPDVKFKKQSCYLESCRLSWDGRYLALPVDVGKTSSSIWELATGSSRPIPDHDGNSACCLGISKLTNCVVAGMNSGYIVLYDLKTLEFVRAFKPPQVSMQSSMAVSPDGRVVVCNGASNSQVCVYDVTTGQWIGNITADNSILGYAFTWNSQFILLMVGSVRGIVQLFLHQPSAKSLTKGKQLDPQTHSRTITDALAVLRKEPAIYGTEMIKADFGV